MGVFNKLILDQDGLLVGKRQIDASQDGVYFSGNGLFGANLTVSGESVFVGNVTLVNTANITIGSKFIANTTQITIGSIPLSANGGTGTSGQVLTSNGTSGAPYWSTVAAGSVPATYVQNTDSRTLSGNLVISGTSFNPSANTILLGNSISRWVVSANTGDFTGTVTGTVANMSTSVNSALLTVGTSFIANTSQITIAAGVPLSANGLVGASGTVLTSNGTTGSPYWAAAAGGGSTVTDNTTFNGTTYPVFANQTSGTLSTAFVSSTKLTYNPSTGQLGATLFSSSSDERLKTNINLIEQSLSKIEQIRGVTFNYIDNNHASVGVIAQDVEKVLPQAVSIDEEGYKAVHYNGVIGLLVEAVKQQQLQIEDLQNQINELKK